MRTEEQRAWSRAYYKANREKVLARQKSPEACERRRANYRRRYAEQKAERQAKERAQRAATPEKFREKERRKREKNRERIREQARARYAANPLPFWKREHARRARLKNAPGRCSTEQLTARFAFFGWRCAYCGADNGLTVDHVIPLSCGGSNWPANLRPACRSCNPKKGARSWREWLQ